MSNVPPFASAANRLLIPWEKAVATLDWDLQQRYTFTAQRLERMLAAVSGPVRLLEVGCNQYNIWPHLLDTGRVEVTRCDILTCGPQEGFVTVAPDQPLPWADGSFDAVVALEVLEHMPAGKRPDFLRDCLRVARHGAIFTCPQGTAEVDEAEALGAAAFQQRHGKPHSFLQEHREFGLPRVEDVCAILRDLGYDFATFDNADLENWLAMLLLGENLREGQGPPAVQEWCNRAAQEKRPGSPGLCYRKIYVCAKTAEALPALEEEPPLETTANPVAPSASAALQQLAAVSAHALSSLESDRVQERETLRTAHEAQVAANQAQRAAHEAQVAAHEAHVAALTAQSEIQIAALQGQLTLAQRNQRRWLQPYLVLDSWVQSLLGSRGWRWMAPLRRLRQVLKPAHFDAAALQAWNQLQADALERGTWRATAEEPQFLVPCQLPAGWLRIRLKMSSDVVGRLAFFALPSQGVADPECLAQAEVLSHVDLDFYVRLRSPALGLRFDPLNTPGRFRIETFEVRHVPGPLATAQALGKKIQLLREHGILLRTLGRGLKTLVCGQLGDFSRKVHATLPGPENNWVANGTSGENLGTTTTLVTPARATPTGERLDIVYVLLSAGLCGGVRVILEHVSRLYARGHNVTLYYCEGDLGWFRRPVPARRFASHEELREALSRFRGIKVATWHETAPWVAASLQPGDRGYYMVQDIEESYAATPEQAAAALETYSLGLRPLTEGEWVHQQLKSRFGLDPTFVSIGLDHDCFQTTRSPREPNRILTQARTWSGGGAEVGARLKGWDTARAVILRTREINPRTTLATFSIEDLPPFPAALKHVHFQEPGDSQLAKLYNAAGLYLLTSNHEGFGLTAAEAMACGCPVVATRADGNEEFCIDGETALTAPPGDVELLAQHCVRLQTDRAFAADLGERGRRFIADYTWDRVVDRLEQEFRSTPAAEEVRPVVRHTPATPASGAGRLGILPRIPRGEYPDLRLATNPPVDCSLVIPTINDVNQVARCVSSCRQFAPCNARLQILVVDDGSADPAILEQLQQAAKELDFELLANQQNLGFSATVNHGLRHAQGRYVVLCNNDIVFDRPWMEPLEEAFAKDPYLGILGARLLYPNGTLQHAGMTKGLGQLRFHHRHKGETADHEPALQSRYVWCVTGALFALRRETLGKLGGLSTAYTMSYEDVDYCLYAWTQGVRVGYCAELVAQHLEGGTRGATPEQKDARSLLWSERERASEAYFDRKWASLRYVESFQTLMTLTRELPPIAEQEGETEVKREKPRRIAV
jgi:GT2 family glycosyltransferase/glycosyltransferase involved in cell wall biosynthesis/SAM-dependent methyltransferase